MADADHGGGEGKKSEFTLLDKLKYNALTKGFNKILGRQTGYMTPRTRQNTPQPSTVRLMYTTLFEKNKILIKDLGEIETRWAEIEHFLYEGLSFSHPAEPDTNSHVFTEMYRSARFFRDYELIQEEISYFRSVGTIELSREVSEEDKLIFKNTELNVENDKKQRKDEIDKLVAKGVIKKDIERFLSDPESMDTTGLGKEILKMLMELSKLDGTIKKSESLLKKNQGKNILPRIKTNKIRFPFVDNRTEDVCIIGPTKYTDITNAFQAINNFLDNYASSTGIGAELRTPTNLLIQNGIQKNLESISELEREWRKTLTSISDVLKKIQEEVTEDTGIVGTKKLKTEFIRFPHTYKVIRSVKVEKHGDEDKEVRFHEKYPDFKFPDEVQAGLDENGWALEVYQDSDDQWKVLTDKWWVELSMNIFHENTIRIKKKSKGGEEVWKTKVIKGVKVSNKYKEKYREGYVRVVPKEWVGDVHHGQMGVGDIDPLDKISFVSNEFDSYRDDFRDGRFHPNSKSSMDYIIAGMYEITPVDPINFDIDNQNEEVRIEFRPIYFNEAELMNKDGKVSKADKLKLGTINPKGGLGKITINNIPEDERDVSRIYDMAIDPPDSSATDKVEMLEHQIREPKHLNPAMDRAALTHKYLHWGRMLYYETADGVNRWSENPFPHISSRGLAKYIIDLVIRSSFSFEEARNILKDHDWDYGIRHYGDPFTTDPLGEGGVLTHMRAQRAEPASAHHE